MAAELYMVSLGPGDMDLITLKGLEALKSVEAICVPTKSEDGSFERSLTYRIVRALMQKYGFDTRLVPVYSPMRFDPQDWARQAEVVMRTQERYSRVAFVTLGDAGIYSSVYYILEIIRERNESLYRRSEVIPGITSFCDASAKLKRPLCLGESALEIVPLLGKEVPRTSVYMRPKIGMETVGIEERGEIYTFEDLNFPTERIYPRKLERVKRYMTLFIDFFKV